MAEAVIGRIEEQDLVEPALHITSVETPPGEEGPGAEVIYAVSKENLLRASRVYALTALAMCARPVT